MKKMSNSKRGFTLTEILIVTAIVVIVSAAAFTGVAITLSRARDTQKNLKENNGDNFENAARSEVDAINEGNADYVVPPSYKPKDSESSEESSSDESTTESSSENTTVAPNTPTPKPTATNTPTPTPKPNTPTPSSSSQQAHSNAAGSSFNYNETWSGNQKITVKISDGQAKSFVVCVPGQENLKWDTYNNASVENLGNGQYKVTPNYNFNEFQLAMSGLTTEGKPPLYIVSYEKV